LAEAAADLVRSEVRVIIAAGATAAGAAKEATGRIPIVFYSATDPVAHRLVASLSRPESNLTSFAVMDETTPKLLEFLHQIKPEARLVAYLLDPSGLSEDARARKAAETASVAANLGLRYRELPVRSRADIEAGIPEAKAQGVEALVVESSTLLVTNRFVVTDLVTRSALPAIYRDRQFAVAGGLLSYGEDLLDLQRRAVVYVDRLLRGARVGDLPVQQASKFELVVNLKAARAIGLDVPPSLLARADEVIE
jgi:putative ABC transport system substrate-binding protein